VARYRGKVSRVYFRADAGFANRDVYEYSKAKASNTRSDSPANRVLQERISYLLKRPVGRPSHMVRRSHASFTYQAGSWTKPRRVVAKAEWHPGELYPRVGFIVTNMARRAENVVAFYNKIPWGVDSDQFCGQTEVVIRSLWRRPILAPFS
jgi:Transposase DDE domain group 1